MCLLVVDTALGMAALLLLGVALVELGLRGDGRPWHGGAVTAADMASSSSLRCHVQTALVSLTILSRPCPKLASLNTDRCADLWSSMNLIQSKMKKHT